MKEKYAKIPLKNFSPVFPFLVYPFYPASVRGAWDFITAILIKFFWLQMKQKLHITHKPVIYVDTELDDKIPFVPEKIDTYMGFIPFLLKPTWMLKKRLGVKKAAPYINEYFHFLASMYKNAASIYKFCLTTTHRPNYKKNHHFRTIHFFDPHYLCVPSLHVTIAAGTYAFFKKKFAEKILPEQETQNRLEEIKKEGIAIIESVLFVKQHSVNCIPIALYMLNASIDNKLLSINDAVQLIDELFSNAPEISENLKKEINNYFHYMYERTLLENCYSNNWQDCVKHWLTDYAKSTGQTI